MDLHTITSDTLKTPWLAGTRMKSLKKSSIQKFSIILAIEEIKSKKMPLKFLAILYLGLCRISNKIHEFLCDELVRFTKHPKETPYKPRLSGIDIPNTKVVNSALRYSGARLSSMPITPQKKEGFRKSDLKIEGLATNLLEDDIRELNFTFISEDFLDPSKQLESLPLELTTNDPAEIRTPKILLNMFKDLSKSTAKKKKTCDNFTLIKSFKPPQIRTIKSVEKPFEFIGIPEKITKRLEKVFGHKEVPRDEEVKIEIGEIYSEKIVKQVEFDEDTRMDIEPVNLELQFDLEESLQLNVISPVKTTQVIKFEEKLNFLIKSDGKILFSEVSKNLDKLSMIRAFNCLLVLASTGTVLLFQRSFYEDIEIKCVDHAAFESQLFFSQLKY